MIQLIFILTFSLLSCKGDLKRQNSVADIKVSETQDPEKINSVSADDTLQMALPADDEKTPEKTVLQKEVTNNEKEKAAVKPLKDQGGQDKKVQKEIVPIKDSDGQSMQKADEEKSIENKEMPEKPEPVQIKDKIENVDVKEAKQDVADILLIDHEKWDFLLKKNVSSSGKVNYASFKSDERLLNEYLKILEETDVKTLNRNQRLAFWINAYNAYTIKLILNNYPVASITEIDNGKPWDTKWIKLDGKVLSLNNIENDIIRPRFKEPRIHFAVNCAAKSCPPLLNRAWNESNLDAEFEKQTYRFVQNKAFNIIQSDEAEVSKIFEWYAEDFGNLTSFLNKYLDKPLNANAKISYMEYDWLLNN